ncbi:hypothetical protein Tco_0985076, partial [Tanacetum coccineum]
NYDNESSDDDNDDDDVGKDEEDEEDEEEEKHLASADPSTMIMSPQVENTEAFETDKSTSTPPTSPYHIILSFETKSRAVRMSDCPEQKNRNHENQTRGTRARGAVHALREGETDQDPNNIKDEIKA